MSDRRDDDHTERMRASDDDATRAMDAADDDRGLDEVDDRTRVFDETVDDEAATTRAMRREDDATQMMGAATYDEPTRTHRIEAVTGPTPHATERIYVPGARRSVGPWVIAACVVAGLILGGILGYTQADPSDNNVVARALVGPDGGVLTFDGAGRVEIPRGALPTATAITVRKEKLNRRIRLGAEGDARSRVYEAGELDMYVFEPPDLGFQQPVKITLPRTGDAEAALVDADDGARVIGVQPGDNTVTITTTSFSFEQSAMQGGSP